MFPFGAFHATRMAQSSFMTNYMASQSAKTAMNKKSKPVTLENARDENSRANRKRIKNGRVYGLDGE